MTQMAFLPTGKTIFGQLRVLVVLVHVEHVLRMDLMLLANQINLPDEAPTGRRDVCADLGLVQQLGHQECDLRPAQEEACNPYYV